MSFDCAGQPLINAPTWQGSVRFQHTQPLANGSDLTFIADTRFSSGYYGAVDFTPQTVLDNYHVSNASLAWTSANGRYVVTGFVRNIENTAVYSTTQIAPNIHGRAVALTGPPRTYGMQFRVNF